MAKATYKIVYSLWLQWHIIWMQMVQKELFIGEMRSWERIVELGLTCFQRSRESQNSFVILLLSTKADPPGAGHGGTPIPMFQTWHSPGAISLNAWWNGQFQWMLVCRWSKSRFVWNLGLRHCPLFSWGGCSGLGIWDWGWETPAAPVPRASKLTWVEAGCRGLSRDIQGDDSRRRLKGVEERQFCSCLGHWLWGQKDLSLTPVPSDDQLCVFGHIFALICASVSMFVQWG
jgi:hypothetical protein